MKKKIMVFCDSYLPSYTSGGGMWTVVNLIDRFSDRYDFYVATRDHDIKGDRKPYRDVVTNAWNQTANSKNFYLSKWSITERICARLVADIRPDAIFLNSSLSTPTIKVLSARRKGLIGDIPVVLAPCGEMSAAALSLKPYKKKLFHTYASMIELYRGVLWKASSATEEDEIRSVVGKSAEVCVAPDLTPKAILPDYIPDWKPVKSPGSAHFVFLSRIMRKKNISYFLECLAGVPDGRVVFDIIGPVEDQAYWRECVALIDRLPANVKVRPLGSFPNREALQRLVESHFFVLPTLDENFGYVFIEAMAAGCPLIVSDRNIWTDIEQNGVGFRIPLDNPETWACRIKQCIEMNDSEYRSMSRKARDHSLQLLVQTDAERANAMVLSRAVREGTCVMSNEQTV